jgi:hypothetical protein
MRLIALLAAFIGASCAPTYEIRPAAGGSVGAAGERGLSMYADPHAWKGDPYDLPNYLTPIAVQLVNYTGGDIRVTYSDFSLVDQNGFRYAAINPYTGTPAGPRIGSNWPIRLDDYDDDGWDDNEVMLASFGSQGTGGGLSSTMTGGLTSGLEYARSAGWRDPGLLVAAGRPIGPQRTPVFATTRLYTVAAPRGAAPAPPPVVQVPGRRFYVYPRSRAWFNYYAPWPYDFYYPPDYGSYVYGWSSGYYPQSPSEDVQRLGLPEGVLKPGGSVSGFLYFQNAGARASQLRLVWHAETPQGQRAATLRVDFVVRPR